MNLTARWLSISFWAIVIGGTISLIIFSKSISLSNLIFFSFLILLSALTAMYFFEIFFNEVTDPGPTLNSCSDCKNMQAVIDADTQQPIATCTAGKFTRASFNDVAWEGVDCEDFEN